MSESSVSKRLKSLPPVTNPALSATVDVVPPVVAPLMSYHVTLNPQVMSPSHYVPALHAVSPTVGVVLSEAYYIPLRLPIFPFIVPRSRVLHRAPADSFRTDS